VPKGDDQNVADDDVGRNGLAWGETDVEATLLEAVITDLLAGQYQNPVRVIDLKAAERWSKDVSDDVVCELRQHCDEQMRGFLAMLLMA
jgi:hypothetical protein